MDILRRPQNIRSLILILLSFSVRDIPEKYEIDKVMMSIDNKYWCGGYKKWLKFSQEGQGLDKAQNCELAKKAKSEYGETLKWQIRKSENKKITIDELKSCRNMKFDLNRSIFVSILSDDSNDFCPHIITVSFKNPSTNDSVTFETEEITRSHDKYQNEHSYELHGALISHGCKGGLAPMVLIIWLFSTHSF